MLMDCINYKFMIKRNYMQNIQMCQPTPVDRWLEKWGMRQPVSAFALHVSTVSCELTTLPMTLLIGIYLSVGVFLKCALVAGPPMEISDPQDPAAGPTKLGTPEYYLSRRPLLYGYCSYSNIPNLKQITSNRWSYSWDLFAPRNFSHSRSTRIPTRKNRQIYGTYLLFLLTILAS